MNKLRLAGVGALLGLLVALGLPADAASAHGALTAPVSRAAACGPDGGKDARSAACTAAIAASEPGAAAAWDNLRVANVNGRDRSVIPDGKLCSGGLAKYAGLDLARADWPTTQVTPGATFTFRYRTTIPHEGTFRLYVTKPGYQPGRALRWADLESKPFLSITDPRRTGGAYVLPGRMPTGRAGQHVVYTIWQNSSTADTYYSCSDVVFPPSKGTEKTAAATPSRQASVAPAAGSAGDEPTAAAGGTADAADAADARDTADEADAVDPSPVAAQEPTGMMNSSRWPVVAGIAAMLAVIGTIGLLALRYRPRPRHRRG
ncbi:lytic polysaccharide monooxygenase auxiliary activity family 9 protein [Cryptosporangium aurantiacum]|uniref:Chitin-binding protein n=1 Tax=Cryptosporangium aurantiacum TaxID=134849 RepID=A0A1M7JS74_9ACTN|nr:lytic polysaccharide monooxygenase [Cryptosporangium aurantiacum]SHM55563.1 chitin-binding protein [Cryptosporangium aurantiacum]